MVETNKNARRDYRLDFCRGVALILIFIDHVPGNPASLWTLRKWAFCDAAEVFVVISGISAYLAYSSTLERFGFLRCAGMVGRRWLRIYGAHLLLIFSTAALVWLASVYFGRNYLDFLCVGPLFRDPRHYIAAAVTLRYLPRYSDILPLYLILFAAAPALILFVRRSPWWALGASGSIYLAARLIHFNLSAGYDGLEWCFNPFAWQLLFVIGVVVGHFGHASVETPAHFGRYERLWLGAAAAFTLFALLAAAPWTGSDASRTLFSFPLWPAEKTFLSPLRVANVVALLYLLAYFVPRQASFFHTPIASLFLACGRNSLPLFGVGVLLSCAGYVALEQFDGKIIAPAVNLAGISFLLAFAWLLDSRRNLRDASGISLSRARAHLIPAHFDLPQPARLALRQPFSVRLDPEPVTISMPRTHNFEPARGLADTNGLRYRTALTPRSRRGDDLF